MRTTIVLADDHDLVRNAIACMLANVPDFEVVGQCSNGRQLLLQVERLSPDVAVVDVSMPELNGIEATRRVREVSPRTRIVALSYYADDAYVKGMIEAGAVAYVLKSGRATEIVHAIRTASRGKVFISPEIGKNARAAMPHDGPPEDPLLRSLSPREREILQLVAEGKSSREIAAELGIGETTVKTHRNHLMTKLNVREVAGLTRQAIKLKIVRID
jgi:DNA-binding NarL/FixJ family response regulator